MASNGKDEGGRMRDESLRPPWTVFLHPSSFRLHPFICNLAASALINYTTPHLPFRNEAEVSDNLEEAGRRDRGVARAAHSALSFN
jgi:hypothetical protein